MRIKRPARLFILILALAALALVIDFPRVPVKFQLGGLKVDTVIAGPDLNIDIAGLKINRELNIKEGLDLSGGTQMTLQVDMSNIKEADKTQALDSATSVIERRVNLYGVSEPVVQSSRVGNDYRIIVELPGVKDINEARNLVGKTALLEIRELINTSGPITYENTKPIGQDGLTGRDFVKAEVTFPSSQTSKVSGSPAVSFELTDEGAKKFSEVTKRLANTNIPLPIFLDKQVISFPTVSTEISSKGQIDGNFTPDEAKALATQLNAGALPAPINVIEQQTIGATLGDQSVHRALLAGILGLLTIAILMISYYGRLGLVATAALIIYTLLTLAIFKLIPVTLTLAGIAGFILSVGMAVDANILIFERRKEELRAGKAKDVSMELGFNRAWPSIRDSNIATIATSLILLYTTTGLIRGFALTLLIGVLVSMFTAIIVSRTFLRMFLKY